VLAETPVVSSMINEVLDPVEAKRLALWDRFKVKLTRRIAHGSAGQLVDFGSGSGRFLYQTNSMFDSAVGVEVVEECVSFAREALGLSIVRDISEVEGKIACLTMWHSMEHISSEMMAQVLEHVRQHGTEDLSVIVSVPNAGSILYRVLGARFAYYDIPSHCQQFSSTSLDLLMRRHGLEVERSYRSLAYSLFGVIQSTLNVFATGHNRLYMRLKRGANYDQSFVAERTWEVGQAILTTLFLPLTSLVVIAELLFPRRAGVITRCYRKCG
jgi:hypothetical protein